jgi:hypothetical protein
MKAPRQQAEQSTANASENVIEAKTRTARAFESINESPDGSVMASVT